MKLLPRPSSPTNSNMHRSPSETSTSAATTTTATHAKKWRFGKALGRIHSGSLREDRHSRLNSDLDAEPVGPLSPAATGPDGQGAASSADDASYRQLCDCVRKVKHVRGSNCDTFYNQYAKVRDQCNAICKNLLTQQAKAALSRLNRESIMESIDEDGPAPQSPAPAPVKTGTSVSGMTERFLGTPGLLRRGSSFDNPSVPGGLDQRSSFSGSSTPDPTKFFTGTLTSSVSAGAKEPPSVAANVNVVWLSAIRDWKNCLENLCESLRASLADTYKQYEANASQDRIDQLFNDKRFRRHAVESMRHASVYKMLSASPDFWPKYSIRFRNYEKVKEDLLEIRALLQAGESGIAPDRMIREITIAPRGDAILEFSNTMLDSPPVYRFRVSSHMLAETSPIFSRMFTGSYDSFNLDDYEEDEILDYLPPPPAKFVCKDGTEAKLFRMPQYEVNEENALSILLHAAHIHNDKIPREIPFSQFVAVAHACLRYRCTSPLEMVVEHRWLPQWMHKASDEMPEGLLIISFVFGLRRLFTRMTKTVIMNLVSEEELQGKNWPQRIKDKIWAVRSAKMAQVQACCAYSVEEYIRPPLPNPAAASNGLGGESSGSSDENRGLPLSSTPRCPKGSHWCDATNLGWMLLVYNEMQMLHTVMQPNILNQDAPPAPRSLSQMVNTLSRAGSAPQPVHTGAACDPAPAFRSAIHDIYNSVSGLTLYDISGSRHGWALSRHKANEPQVVLGQLMLKSDSPQPKGPRVGLWSLSEKLRLKVFRELDTLEDLHAAARMGKPWYETFKANELSLMRRILRAGRRQPTLQPPKLSLTAGPALLAIDDKVLKTDADAMMTERRERDDVEEESIMIEEDDDEDDDEVEVVFDYLSPVTDQTTTSPPPTHPKTTPPKSPVFMKAGSSRMFQNPEMFSGMTREEAERILWPDIQPSSPSPKPDPPVVDATVPGNVSANREKFRATDCASMTELKSLAYVEDKKLRDEHDRKLRGKEVSVSQRNGSEMRFGERVGRSESSRNTHTPQRSDSAKPTADGPIPWEPDVLKRSGTM